MSNENRYFYKIIDNVDFVWKIELIRDDPYKAGEFRVQHFVHNTKRYENRILNNFHSLTQNKFLEGYKEIRKGILNEDNCYYDNEIRLVKKDLEWGQLVAMRHVVAFDKIVPIELGGQINQEIRDLYDVVMNWNKSFAQAVYNAGHDYYKSLWLIDEFFSSPNLDTVDKFLPTIELQEIYFPENFDVNEIRLGFRPSWDEEHGMRVVVNLKNDTIRIDS